MTRPSSLASAGSFGLAARGCLVVPIASSVYKCQHGPFNSFSLYLHEVSGRGFDMHCGQLSIIHVFKFHLHAFT